ncbi:MAG: hypothetical protein ABIK09_13965 [Pseudomonadota bacterium]
MTPRKRQSQTEPPEGEGRFGRRDACLFFWKRLEDLRSQCLEDLRFCTDRYRELSPPPDPGDPFWFVSPWRRSPQAAKDLVHAWAQSWRLRCTQDSDNYWPEHFAHLYLEAPYRPHLEWFPSMDRGLEVLSSQAPEGRVEMGQFPLYSSGKLSSTDPEKAARARSDRHPVFELEAEVLLHRAIPEGFETEAEVAAVNRFIRILAEAGARLDAPTPLFPWSRLFEFEDGWNPWEEESRTKAYDRIQKRFHRKLEVYLDQIEAGACWIPKAPEQDSIGRFFRDAIDLDGEYCNGPSPLRDPKIGVFRKDAFDWLVLRVVPEVKDGPTWSPGTIRDQIKPKQGCPKPDRTTIYDNTDDLADFLDLEIPELKRGPRRR